jgi:ribosomal protein S18 acetylase RimI-like enzyme
VTTNNGPALALYRGAGFHPARRRRWLLGRLLFRAPGALYMEKRLSSS